MVSGSRRADLTLPATVLVADLLPWIADLLPTDSERPRDLATVTGARLRPDAALRQQDIHDGAVLWLVDPEAVDRPAVYEDAVRLVAGVSAASPRWPVAWTRPLTSGIAAACALAAAVALGVDGQHPAAAAAILAGVTVALASVWSWRGPSRGSALAGVVAMGYGAASGALLAPRSATFGMAAAGALVTGTAVLLWSAPAGGWLPSLVVAVGLVAAAGLAGAFRGSAVAVLLGLSVYAAEVLPALVVADTRAARDAVDPGAPDPGAGVVAREARTAMTRLTRGAVTCGLVVLLAAPVVVSDPLGLVLLLACGVAAATRAGRTNDRLLVAVDLVTGVGAVVIAVVGLIWQRRWTSELAGALVLASAVAALVGSGRAGRRLVAGLHGAALLVVGPLTALCGVLAWPGR